MDIRIKHRRLFFAACALILSVLFCLPWLSKDFVGIEHDTFYHLSRIDALAEALFHGDFIPRIYPLENFGYGYASPMFYSDFFLILPACLYHFGLPLSLSYVLTMFLTVWAGNYAMLSLCCRVSKREGASLVIASGWCFANYHITDIYVRSALGEAMALVFLPVLMEGLYILFQEQDRTGGTLLFAGLAGLILTHNLSFLLGVVISGIYFLLFAQDQKKDVLLSFFAAFFLAFLSTAWFTLPMIEQLNSQRFYLHWYAGSSTLEHYAIEPWQYLRNTTVFGYGSNSIARDQQMTLNIGYFLTLAPLFALLPDVRKGKNRQFVLISMILGYVTLFLPIRIFPWEHMSFLSILQFPWRLLTIAMVLLAIPAVSGIAAISENRKVLVPVLLGLVIAEGMYHVLPVYERTYGITSKNQYADLLSGEIVDPCFSATYVRVQLAGGEYLPADSPDFRYLDPAIRTSDYLAADIPFEKNRTALSFTLTEESMPQDHILILPLSWYLGYTASGPEGTEVSSSSRALVQVFCPEEGTYCVYYGGTAVQKLSALLSGFTLLILMAGAILKQSAAHNGTPLPFFAGLFTPVSEDKGRDPSADGNV